MSRQKQGERRLTKSLGDFRPIQDDALTRSRRDPSVYNRTDRNFGALNILMLEQAQNGFDVLFSDMVYDVATST